MAQEESGLAARFFLSLPPRGTAAWKDCIALEALGEVEKLVGPSIEGLGFDLVRVHLTGGGAPTLQIMAERKDRREMSVEDCAEISRLVSALLDVEDPIAGSYTLEVSSPGLDRPLVRAEDYERFAGFEVRVETHRSIEGRKRFRGRLVGRRGADVVIAVEDVEHAIPFGEVLRGKLMLTDALIADAMKGRGR